MADPLIHGKKPILTASAVLKAVGSSLGEIRQEDDLTWAEVGGVMRRSEDQAAKYADASAEMGVVAFAHARMQWGSRFSGPLDRLCIDARPDVGCDASIQSTVIRASLAIAEAKANGNEIYGWEVKACRSVIEAARDALDDLLRKADQ